MTEADKAPSLYAILAVPPAAAPEDIEASYRRALDRLTAQELASYALIDDGSDAALRAQIEAAYATLADPGRRAAYDRENLHLPVPPPPAPETPAAAPGPGPPPVPSHRAVPTPKAAGGRRRRPLLPAATLAELTPETEYGGAVLRRLREAAAASLDDVAELTKIGKRYLTALEEDDDEALPARVYVSGFVTQYAHALGLDPVAVNRSYMALYARRKGARR